MRSHRTVRRSFPIITESKPTSGRALPPAAHATAARDASAGALPRVVRFLRPGARGLEARPSTVTRKRLPFPENQNPKGRRKRRDRPSRDRYSSRNPQRRRSLGTVAANLRIPAPRSLGNTREMREHPSWLMGIIHFSWNATQAWTIPPDSDTALARRCLTTIRELRDRG